MSSLAFSPLRASLLSEVEKQDNDLNHDICLSYLK